MKKLKIAVFVDQLVIGGVQKDAIEEVRVLRKMGYAATLVALMRKGFQKEFKKFLKGVPFEFLSDRYPKILQHSVKFPIFSFFSTLHVLSAYLAPLFVKKNEWDAVVAHGTTTCFTTITLSQKRQIRYLAVIHDPMEYILKKVYRNTLLRFFFSLLLPLLFLLEKAIIKNASEIAVNSKVHSAFLEKTYHIKPKVLTGGTTILTTLPKTRQNYLLGFSRWEKAKKPQLLLQILNKIPQTSLVIGGSWTRNEEFLWFKKEVEKFKLTDRVKIIPFVNNDEAIKLFSQALVFIHPNFESFGMGGLEAAGCGCPVIIPLNSGITEILKNNKDGIFPRKVNLADFYPAVKKLVDNPQLAYKMGESAYQKVKKYSWQKHAEQLLRIVNEVVKKENRKIAILETGHASETYLAGGDKVLEKMAVFFPENIQLNIITPQIGIKHWRQSKLKIKEQLLPESFLDNRPGPITIFLVYLLRIWQSYRILDKLSLNLIISSTNVLPDILPAFFLKLRNKKIPWSAWVYHLIPLPHKRPGNFFVNCVSYLMQIVTLVALKIKVDRIYCTDTTTVNSLVKFGFPKKKIVLQSIGIDYQKIKNHQIRRKYYSDAVFLGRLHPTKGVFDLTDIWEDVTEKIPKARLIIIGQGPKEITKQIESRISDYNLQKNIILTGGLPENKLLDILKSSKVFLFTDYEAGFSMATAESMAAGLPVVAYDLPIFGNIYKKGFLTVPLGDKQQMAQQIVKLLKNPKLQQQLSKEALQQAQNFTWSKAGTNFWQIIEKSFL